ncbi:spore cortex biosynthesis protein YabQ [Paenibacillus flagellatus]|uniref:Spore cortex biosynthesis protein YabQ n=1 Tax=Paenibacillus flagellatus TaxID=2211139 RepID=A0A2V5K8Y3_9BACL|nr:spore cortex biosynthesis protein YabQ [Paenibacillus flagellatus]PYI50230.1 spore cortex biosynthesis protein YabQ [Paenibacillus flagellatus]
MSLHVQFLTLSVMAGSGAFMGALFDVYRVLSGQLRPPRWLVPLLDAVYWIAATLFVFRALLYSNYGQVRLYVFIGLALGVWLYFRIASKLTIRLVHLVIRIVLALIRFGRRTIEVAVIKPIVLLYRLVIVLFGFLAAFSVFLFKIVLQLLYPFRLLGRALWKPLRKRVKAPNWWIRFTGFCVRSVQAVRKWFGRNG